MDRQSGQSWRPSSSSIPRTIDEMENALLEHPNVTDCPVVGVPDDKWGEVGLAAIVARAGTSPSDAEQAVFLDDRLARYKIPKHYRVVDVLPRSGAGKVQKLQLRVGLAIDDRSEEDDR